MPVVFAEAAYANLGITGEVVATLWQDRIVGGVGANTRRAYTAGFASLARYGSSMGWEFPFLGGQVVDDVLRIVGWINHMAIDEALTYSTVDAYITGAKTQLMQLNLTVSGALGKKGDPRHVWVRNAVQSVAKRPATRIGYSRDWILEGRRYWKEPVYVAVVLIYMASLRSGELLANYSGGIGEHLLRWENLQFLTIDLFGEQILSRTELRYVCADAIQITFDSRKWQELGRARPIPPITRLFPKPSDGSPSINLSDFGIDVGMCAVTLLQSWFIWLSEAVPVREQHPIMQDRSGKVLDSRTVVESMRRISTAHGVNSADVVIHSLKHGSLTALANAGASSVDIAMAGGHSTIESSVPYLHPGVDQGRRNSEILGQKQRAERSDV